MREKQTMQEIPKQIPDCNANDDKLNRTITFDSLQYLKRMNI